MKKYLGRIVFIALIIETAKLIGIVPVGPLAMAQWLIANIDWAEMAFPLILFSLVFLAMLVSSILDTIKTKKRIKRMREQARLQEIREQQEREYRERVAYNQMISSRK
jgi:hypothetical protein